MIENDIVQKTAVVTGAASGIGYAIAKKCVSLGMNVVLADIEEDRLLNANVRFDKGSKTLPIPTDVSKPEQVELLAKRLLINTVPFTIISPAPESVVSEIVGKVKKTIGNGY